MLDKLLFRFRSGWLDLAPLLGSWKLSVVLMVCSAVFYLLLTIYAFSTPTHVVRSIAGLAVFWILYVLLLLNTVTCLWNRFPRLRRQIGARPLFGGVAPDRTTDLDEGCATEEAAARIRGLGYSIVQSDADGIFGIRKRWTALGTYLFHGAFFLLAIGFLLSIGSRQESKIWVAEGEDFTGADSQFLSRTEPRPLATGVEVPHFRVDVIRPEFWRDQLLFTRLEADLTMLPDGERRTTRINRPIMVGFSRFIRLSGFGYAPRYQIRDARGRVVESAFVKLNVFPPGQRDYFTPEILPYRVYVELYPDARIVANEVRNRSLALVDPVFVVTVYRGRFVVAKASLRPGEEMDVEGVRLGFPEIRYWGEFTQVHDVGIVWIFASFIIGLAGLILKSPGRRQEARWVPGRDGRGGELLMWSNERRERGGA